MELYFRLWKFGFRLEIWAPDYSMALFTYLYAYLSGCGRRWFEIHIYRTRKGALQYRFIAPGFTLENESVRFVFHGESRPATQWRVLFWKSEKTLG